MDLHRLEQEIGLLHDRVCYALTDPKRVLILYILSRGRRSVNAIAQALAVPQSTVSRHLRVLRERALVHTEREGTTVYYELADRRIVEALDLMRAILETQLKASADLVQSFGVE